jgi:hypothetical protein
MTAPKLGPYLSADRRFAHRTIDDLEFIVRRLDAHPADRAQWLRLERLARQLAAAAGGVADELKNREPVADDQITLEEVQR